MDNTIAIFEEKQIRQIEFEGHIWFSVVDIIEVLTDSISPRDYWTTMKRREPQMPTLCRRFKLLASDSKMRLTDCANTEGVSRQKHQSNKAFISNASCTNCCEYWFSARP